MRLNATLRFCSQGSNFLYRRRISPMVPSQKITDELVLRRIVVIAASAVYTFFVESLPAKIKAA